MSDACEKCGVVYEIGDWPFCPHGRSQAAVQSDRLANPWIENLDHQPVYCETKQDLQREADKRGLRLMDEWAGPRDKHLTNWAAGIDAQTLANVTELLSRGARVDPEVEIRCETFKGEIRGGTLSELTRA